MEHKIKDATLASIEEIPLIVFLDMPPAPGHRDSEGRAIRAAHLHKYVDEHAEVEIAEYKDADGNLCRARMTGNTRAAVWKCGLSDSVPSKVQARVYHMADEQEVRDRMLYHDSPEAAWTGRDYAGRAINMTYGDGWKPESKALRGGSYIMALRQVDALIHGKWTYTKESRKVEKIMPEWRRELQETDIILGGPVAQSIKERKPYQSGVIAGCLLILRHRSIDQVRPFIQSVMDDSGTKTDDGYDGVQQLVEQLSKKKSGVGVENNQVLLRAVLSCFLQWEGNKRLKGMKKVDPLEWHQEERERQHRTTKEAVAAA